MLLRYARTLYILLRISLIDAAPLSCHYAMLSVYCHLRCCYATLRRFDAIMLLRYLPATTIRRLFIALLTLFAAILILF